VDTVSTAYRHDASRQLDVRLRKPRPVRRPRRTSRSVQNTDQIDHGVLSIDQLAENRIVVHVAFDNIDSRQHDQVSRSGTPPRWHCHLQATCRQAGHDVTTNESGAANDENIGNLHAANSIVRCLSCVNRASHKRARATSGGAAPDVDDMPPACRSPGRVSNYGNSVLPAAFGLIVPRRVFNDGAWPSNSAA
jgi:hypothetical protein